MHPSTWRPNTVKSTFTTWVILITQQGTIIGVHLAFKRRWLWEEYCRILTTVIIFFAKCFWIPLCLSFKTTLVFCTPLFAISLLIHSCTPTFMQSFSVLKRFGLFVILLLKSSSFGIDKSIDIYIIRNVLSGLRLDTLNITYSARPHEIILSS